MTAAIFLTGLFGLAASAPALAASTTPTHGSSLHEALESYIAIGDDLAGASVKEVPDDARNMLVALNAVRDDASSAPHMGHGTAADMEAAHASMRTALQVLSADDVDIEAARQAYKDLSAEFVTMAQSMYSPQPDDPKWEVMTCPMAHAEWIQVDGPVANPFLDTSMKTCGKPVSALRSEGVAQ